LISGANGYDEKSEVEAEAETANQAGAGKEESAKDGTPTNVEGPSAKADYSRAQSMG
jgi:hypothetical protein